MGNPGCMRRVGMTLIALSLLAGTAGAGPGDARYSVDRSVLDDALGCRGGKASLDGAGRSEPVLLVHGTGVSRRQNWGWSYWQALPEAGFETCWVQLPHAALVDIQVSSEYVARAVEVMHRATGERIDVLGHSQGGLQPRWTIKYFPSGRYIDDYVSLATPNHGTTVADAETSDGSSNPAVWQMRRTARFLAALNEGDETWGRSDYTNVYTETDQLVQPVGTQALEGAANYSLQELCPGRPVEHLAIAGDGLTWLLVLDAFTHDGPADESRLPQDMCSATTVPGSSAPPADAWPDYSGFRQTDREPRLKWYARS